MINDLKSALDFLRAKSAVEILDAGQGPRRWIDLSPAFCALCDIITYLEPNAQRLAAAKKSLGGSIHPIQAEFGDTGFVKNFDLIYIDVPPRKLSGFFGGKYFLARSLLTPGGALVLNLPLATVTETARPEDVEAFHYFTRSISENAQTDAQLIQRYYEKFVGLSLASITKPAHTPVNGFEYKSFVFRNHPEAEKRKTGRPLTSKKNFFWLEEAIAFLYALKSKVDFVEAGEYMNALKTQSSAKTQKPVHCLKHDIHQDLQSALRFARAEAKIGVRGVYFVMHPHLLTRKYIDLPETIDVLKEIASLGHDIGVHVDVLELTIKGRGVIPELKPFITKLRAEGLTIRHGNTHGNTAYRHKGFSPQMVFAECAQRAKGLPPPPAIRNAIGSQSLKALWDELGIDGWFDASVHYRGNRISDAPYGITDNYRTLSAWEMPTDQTCAPLKVLEGDLWDLSPNLRDRAVELVGDAHCLHLIHPQFYR